MIPSSDGQNNYPEDINDRLNKMSFVIKSLIYCECNRLNGLVYPNFDAMKEEVCIKQVFRENND